MATFTHTITLHCFVVARPFALLSLVFCPFSAVFTFVSLVSIYARYDITIDRDTTQCRPTRLNGFLAACHAEVGIPNLGSQSRLFASASSHDNDV